MTSLIEQVEEKSFSRRTFLKGGGVLIVSFGLPLQLAGKAGADSVPFPDLDPSQLDSWLAIAQDGKVTAFTGRTDNGQNKQTAFAQIIADELDAPFDAITVIMGDTARTVRQGGSSASDGALHGSRPVRHAAAEARRVLLGLAAAKFGVGVADLSVSDGVVSLKANPSQKVSYGDLIGGKRFNTALQVAYQAAGAQLAPTGSLGTMDLLGQARIKDPSQYKWIGKSVPAMQIPYEVTATSSPNWDRVHNVRLPGMVHARVVLPPSLGARLISVDGFKTRPAGLIRVAAKGDFLAVVAQEEWQAIEAMRNIKVTWQETPSLPGSGDVFEWLRTAPVKTTLNVTGGLPVGNVDAALATAAKTYQAEYRFPANAHAIMGPTCAVADVQGNQCTVWAGTEDQDRARTAISGMLGLPFGSVRYIPVQGAGSYGRNDVDDAGPAAAYLSQLLGKPVRVQWMREQEQGWEPHFAPYLFTLRAGVDSSGAIIAYEAQGRSWATPHLNELPLVLMNRAPLEGGNAGSSPPGGAESAAYLFPNQRIQITSVPQLLRGVPMRSPSKIQSNFAGESFMDEIAADTGQDPIAIRLRHLGDNIDAMQLGSTKPRTTGVLQAVQQLSGWQSRPSPGPDAKSGKRVVSGRGVAQISSQRGTYVATVAEVDVDKKTGKVRVKRLHVAVDAGQVINPKGLESQILGATTFSVSRTLHEQVVFNKSKILATDWVTYPILRFNEVPDEIKITVIDRQALAVQGSFDNGGTGMYLNGGIGEPPNSVVPAAVGNAIFDATGVRIRETPFTPARVRAALKAAGVA
jgi:nicotinate dehydrogenase subunit B